MVRREVKFFVRIFPTVKRDIVNFKIENNRKVMHVRSPPDAKKYNPKFIFWEFITDGIFCNSCQDNVYEDAVNKAVVRALDGESVLFLAYGATGTGKSYTMSNLRGKYEHRGIVPRIVKELFQLRDELIEVTKIKVYISCLEFEGPVVHNLLRNEPNKIIIKRGNVPMAKCINEPQALRLIFDAESRRKYQKNFASCSTFVLTIHLDCMWLNKANSHFLSKIQLVDMAGIECISSTARSDAQQIMSNMAMYSINYVLVNAQRYSSVDDKVTIARASPLTEFIGQTLLNGNIRLLAHVRLTENDLMPTISTLRLGANIKLLPAPELVYEKKPNQLIIIQNLQDENRVLKEELLLNELLKGVYTPNNISQEELNHIKRMAEAYMQGRIDEVPVLSVTQYPLILPMMRNIYKNEIAEAMKRETYKVEEQVSVYRRNKLSLEMPKTLKVPKRKPEPKIPVKSGTSKTKLHVLSAHSLSTPKKKSSASMKSKFQSSSSESTVADISYLFMEADDIVKSSLWQEFFQRYPELDKRLRLYRLQVMNTLREKEDASIMAVRLRCQLDEARVKLEDAQWRRKSSLGEKIGPDGLEIQSEVEKHAELIVEDTYKNYVASRELAASAHAKYMDSVTTYNEFNEVVQVEFQDYVNKIYTTTLVLPQVDEQDQMLLSYDRKSLEVHDKSAVNDNREDEEKKKEEQAMIYYEHLQKSHGKNLFAQKGPCLKFQQ